jgi:cytochrome c biogenesis protein CcdA
MNDLMQQAGLLGLGTALVTGFLFSFNPASFATVPVVLAYVTKARALKEAVMLCGGFIVGMITTHVVLGIGAALGGDWIRHHGSTLERAPGGRTHRPRCGLGGAGSKSRCPGFQ